MKFDVTYYDFDRDDNTMKDGHHLDIEAADAAEAVGVLIRRLSLTSPEYPSITEVDAEDEDGTTAAAYRVGESEWELHIYSPSGDDLSFCAFNA